MSGDSQLRCTRQAKRASAVNIHDAKSFASSREPAKASLENFSLFEHFFDLAYRGYRSRKHEDG